MDAYHVRLRVHAGVPRGGLQPLRVSATKHICDYAGRNGVRCRFARAHLQAGVGSLSAGHASEGIGVYDIARRTEAGMFAFQTRSRGHATLLFQRLREGVCGLGRGQSQPDDKHIRVGVYATPVREPADTIAGGAGEQVHQQAERQTPARFRGIYSGSNNGMARICVGHQGGIGHGARTDRSASGQSVFGTETE